MSYSYGISTLSAVYGVLFVLALSSSYKFKIARFRESPALETDRVYGIAGKSSEIDTRVFVVLTVNNPESSLNA